MVDPADPVLVTGADPADEYVSRGGHKLAGALAAFGPAGCASPGGAAWTRARRPAGSPTCCCAPARPRWSPSTSATASWPGRCAPIRGCAVLERTNVRTLTPEAIGGPVDADRGRPVVHLAAAGAAGAGRLHRRRRRPGADGQAAVRGGQGAGRRRRRGARSGAARRGGAGRGRGRGRGSAWAWPGWRPARCPGRAATSSSSCGCAGARRRRTRTRSVRSVAGRRRRGADAVRRREERPMSRTALLVTHTGRRRQHRARPDGRRGPDRGRLHGPGGRRGGRRPRPARRGAGGRPGRRARAPRSSSRSAATAPSCAPPSWPGRRRRRCSASTSARSASWPRRRSTTSTRRSATWSAREYTVEERLTLDVDGRATTGGRSSSRGRSTRPAWRRASAERMLEVLGRRGRPAAVAVRLRRGGLRHPDRLDRVRVLGRRAGGLAGGRGAAAGADLARTRCSAGRW